jgi:hypothetical protein
VTAKAAPESVGDIRTRIALDADTKLDAFFYVRGRDSEAAMNLVGDLGPRFASRVQLTSDGHKPYLQVIEGALGADIDYAMLIKTIGPCQREPRTATAQPAARALSRRQSKASSFQAVLWSATIFRSTRTAGV